MVYRDHSALPEGVQPRGLTPEPQTPKTPDPQGVRGRGGGGSSERSSIIIKLDATGKRTGFKKHANYWKTKVFLRLACFLKNERAVCIPSILICGMRMAQDGRGSGHCQKFFCYSGPFFPRGNFYNS